LSFDCEMRRRKRALTEWQLAIQLSYNKQNNSRLYRAMASTDNNNMDYTERLLRILLIEKSLSADMRGWVEARARDMIEALTNDAGKVLHNNIDIEHHSEDEVKTLINAFPSALSFIRDEFSENEAHNPIQIPVAVQVPVEVDSNDDTGQSCRYYALRQGRYTKCCIYVSEQDLLPQIDGFKDAEYMAFDSWEDARRYVTSTCTLQVLPTTEPIMHTYDAAIGNSRSSNNITDTDVDVDVDTMPAGCPPMPPLPAVGASIPCLDLDAFINEHIAMKFFSRIMHVDANVDAICAELRRCFDISSMDELDKMTKD